MKKIDIYTDGACQPNPGQCGCGIALYENDNLTTLFSGGYMPRATNNIAEINALYYALITVDKYIKNKETCKFTIYSDSSYSINCITKWAYGWKKANWKRKKGDIKNLELIKNIFFLYEKLKSKIKIKHVKGHSGVEGNELADRMAILAIKEERKVIKEISQPYNIEEILLYS